MKNSNAEVNARILRKDQNVCLKLRGAQGIYHQFFLIFSQGVQFSEKNFSCLRYKKLHCSSFLKVFDFMITRTLSCWYRRGKPAVHEIFIYKDKQGREPIAEYIRLLERRKDKERS